MKRRAFITTGCTLGIMPVMGMPGISEKNEQKATGEGQYFEWITYQLHLGNKQRLVADYYRDVAIPALNKAGIMNVGVFNVKHGPNDPTLHVIIPHPSLESVVTLNNKLLDDKSFVQAGGRFLNAPLSDMAFVSMEKTILKAFDSLPEMQVPKQKKANSPRIIQVRTYEAPSLVASKKKIQMFDEGGETAIFQKTGLQPVLMGETIAGNRVPNLVYMLAFDDMNDLAKKWEVFGKDPDWLKLRANTYYAETVSRINDWIWTPAACSQI